MSKSANIVAASLLNRHYATIRIGRFNFRVYQPRIKDLARAFSKERTDLSIDGRAAILAGGGIETAVSATLEANACSFGMPTVTPTIRKSGKRPKR